MSSVIKARRKSWPHASLKGLGGCSWGSIGPWVVVAFVLIASACTRHEAVVSTLLIDRLPGAETLGLDRNELRELTEAALGENNKFRWGPNANDGKTLRLSIGTDRPEQIFLGLEYDRGDESETVQVARWVRYKGKEELKSALATGLNENLKELSERIEELTKKEGALKSLQDYAEGKSIREGSVMSALEQIDESKDMKAVPVLVAALKRPNIRVGVKVLQTLGMLKDESTVDAITEFAELKSPEIRRHAIEAVRKIGGKSAAAWLFTLSTGHPDANVRSASLEALREVEGGITKAL